MLKSPVLTLLVFFLGTIHVRSVHAQENSLSPPACSQTVYFRFDKAEVKVRIWTTATPCPLWTVFSPTLYMYGPSTPFISTLILHPKVRVTTTLSSPAVVHRPWANTLRNVIPCWNSVPASPAFQVVRTGTGEGSGGARFRLQWAGRGADDYRPSERPCPARTTAETP